ncbi:MAG: hypothetical protein JST26_07250 [Bacteroidetes bacterium]|nr:hypothetical protein [Bacteroidota bacterium]
MKTILYIAFLFLPVLLFGQQADTVLSGSHFNYIKRFTNGTVAEIGNYLPGDTLKNGAWYYYYGDGKPYLQGHYKKNERVGTWLYYDRFGNVSKENPSLFAAMKQDTPTTTQYKPASQTGDNALCLLYLALGILKLVAALH